MDTKINSLTEQQVSQFAIYRDKWLNIGLNTEPIDIPAAEDTVRQCYELAGLSAPQTIICVDSPLSAISNVLENNQIANGLKSASNLVSDQVYYQFRNHVMDQVGNKINNQISNQVSNQVSNQIINQVRNQIINQVRNQVWNQVLNQVLNRKQINQCYGCHDAGWLSYYDYLREVCGLVKETEEVTGLIALAKCCGWWMPYENIAIIQHRPCLIELDDNKRLHCDNGMSVKYRDGFGVWAIHGVTVDEQIVIKPNEQTIKQITEEPNAEVKRIRIERFGWDRYLTEIGAEVIDSRHNDVENTEETLVRTPDRMTILLPTCKTGRLFSLEVPPEISTCEQAQNWLHGGSQLDTIVEKTRVVGRS